jgi:hypothetical protein
MIKFFVFLANGLLPIKFFQQWAPAYSQGWLRPCMSAFDRHGFGGFGKGSRPLCSLYGFLIGP